MKRLRLAIDVDDVLAGFNQGFQKVAKGIYPDRPLLDLMPEDWYYTNWKLKFWELRRVWNKVFDTPWFWLGLDRLSNTKLLKELTDTHECYFLTARSDTGGISAKLQTEQWLKNAGVELPTVLISSDKVPIIKALNIDAFIDDKASTIEYGAHWNKCEMTLCSCSNNTTSQYPLRVDTFDEWAKRFLGDKWSY